MKRNHATVWVPPRTVGERAFAGEPLLWVARQTGAKGAASIERQSLDALDGLKSVNLIFDARDVSLLHATLPQLPPAKLQKALPNFVEEMLLQDVGACAFAIGEAANKDERLVAVIDKVWLEFVIGAFERRGLWVTAAWPAQLTLPLEPGSWSMLCVNDGIALRRTSDEGSGWVSSDHAQARAETIVAALSHCAATEKPPSRISAFCDDPSWASALESAGKSLGVSIRMSSLSAARACPLDLLAARPSTAGQRWLGSIDWLAWRLPLGLAAACLVAWLVGLNIHWAQLTSERNALKASLERKFRQTFPNTPVVVDPMLQMQRQVATLRSRSGQSGPEDFGPLLGRLPAALGGRQDAVAGIEYREGRLRLRFAPTFVESRASREGLIEAFRRQGLQLKFDGEGQAGATLSLVS